MAPKLTATAARQSFSDMVNRAAYGGERIVVHRRQKPVAAVVPLADLELLEQMEDRRDVIEARKRRREPTVPWEKIKRDLKL